MVTQMISSELELHRLNTGRQPRVVTANRLLKQLLFRLVSLFVTCHKMSNMVQSSNIHLSMVKDGALDSRLIQSSEIQFRAYRRFEF
jgi:20S proteasome subunit beta 2